MKRQRQEDECDDELNNVFNTLFSTRRPKDAGAGFSSGLKSVTKGTLAGAASLVAAPIAGAQQDGVRGFFSGLATGVVSAVALPVTGLCVGAVQVGRGMFNSAEAIRCHKQGMTWDHEKREWLNYMLDDEFKELEAAMSKLDKNNGSTSNVVGSDGPERKVKDREYYDLLKISTNATQGQIKKAYYKEARNCHPDKCPDDPEAAAKFQNLGTAYQTLFDEQKRAAYDKNGKPETNSAETENEIDAHVFFNVMFGSALVEPYIGELWIATTADTVMKDAVQEQQKQFLLEAKEEAGEWAARSLASEQASLRQKMREVKCAINIRKRIEPYVNGTESVEAFTEGCKKEADNIGNGAYGATFLTTMGQAMLFEAEEYIGFQQSFLGIDGHVARTKKKFSSINNNTAIFNAGLKAARAGRKAYKDVEVAQQEALAAKQKQEGEAAASGETPKAETKEDEEGNMAQAKAAEKHLEESLPVILELVWAINVRDISQTIKKSSKKLFSDASLDLAGRAKRAEAMKILGSTFFNVGKELGGTTTQGTDSKDIKARAEVAVMSTMAKAQGQEMSPEEMEEMIKQAKAMSAEREAQAQQQQQQQQQQK